MKLATFERDGRRRIGVVTDGGLVDLAERVPTLPGTLRGLLAAGPEALEAAREVAAASGARLSLDAVQLCAPVPDPPKFLAIGLNYADHVVETGREPPGFPIFFNKQVSCVNGPYDPVQRPRVSHELDYEGELGFVIGRRARHIPRGRAREVIAGFLVVNDVSVRDWQARAPTMTLGKSFDTHGPTGPWLVTPDEVGDPHALELRTWVNGELRQHASTRQLVHDCYAIVETLSSVFTLEPGDLITTGTPAGVAAGMRPPRWLQPGDVVRVEIERIGHIENRVVEEPDPLSRS